MAKLSERSWEGGEMAKLMGVQVFTLSRSQSPCNHALALVSMARRSVCALSLCPLGCVVNLTLTLPCSPVKPFPSC